MDKAALLAELTGNGNINTFQRTPSWDKAFEAYNKANKEHLRASCGSCFRKVKAWLQG